MSDSGNRRPKPSNPPHGGPAGREQYRFRTVCIETEHPEAARKSPQTRVLGNIPVGDVIAPCLSERFMYGLCRQSSLLVPVLLALAPAFSQTPEVVISNPQAPPVIGPLMRPFHMERRVVSPARLDNSPRMESLVRAGNLYLSVDDVIALALENNIDIAVQRYGPYLAREVLRRTEGGGPLRSVGLAIVPGPASVSLAGVNAGVVGLSEAGSGVSSGGGIVIQLGTSPVNLDPYLYAGANFNHVTSPQSNTFLNQVPFLLNNNRSYQVGYGQSFASGTSAQLTYGSTHISLNSPGPLLNPYNTGYIDLYVTQQLMQGFGFAVNTRNIRVAKNNMKVTDLQMKLQVITTVSAILNLYWDLVSFNEDVRVKRRALEVAQELNEGNKHQAELGAPGQHRSHSLGGPGVAEQGGAADRRN